PYLRRRAVPAGERLLVGHHVRRQEPAPDQEPDQPLPDQLPDVAEHEEKRGWFVDALYPERFTRRRQGIQLAACSERHDLPRHAPLLAEDGGALNPSAR